MLQLVPRKRRVLAAVVEKYVETAEPVGSRTLLREAALGVSSATIRNDMAELEEMELLTHPHTSAGRMPTDAGYRFYVDELLQPRALNETDTTHIQQSLVPSLADVEAVLEAACRLMAQVTNYTAIVMVPTEERDAMKHVQLGNVNSHRVLVIIVTSAGHVEHRLFDVPSYIPPTRLQRIANFLNEKLRGRSLADVKALRYEDIEAPSEFLDPFAKQAFEFVKESIVAQADDKVLVEGVVYILHQPEFSQVERARTVLTALEERELLASLMNVPLQQSEVAVIIGCEHRIEPMRALSFIGAPYRVGQTWLGSVGVLGPTRLKYRDALPAVQFLAQQVGECLTEMMA